MIFKILNNKTLNTLLDSLLKKKRFVKKKNTQGKQNVPSWSQKPTTKKPLKTRKPTQKHCMFMNLEPCNLFQVFFLSLRNSRDYPTKVGVKVFSLTPLPGTSKRIREKDMCSKE